VNQLSIRYELNYVSGQQSFPWMGFVPCSPFPSSSQTNGVTCNKALGQGESLSIIRYVADYTNDAT